MVEFLLALIAVVIIFSPFPSWIRKLALFYIFCFVIFYCFFSSIHSMNQRIHRMNQEDDQEK